MGGAEDQSEAEAEGPVLPLLAKRRKYRIAAELAAEAANRRILGKKIAGKRGRNWMEAWRE